MKMLAWEADRNLHIFPYLLANPVTLWNITTARSDNEKNLHVLIIIRVTDTTLGFPHPQKVIKTIWKMWKWGMHVLWARFLLPIPTTMHNLPHIPATDSKCPTQALGFSAAHLQSQLRNTAPMLPRGSQALFYQPHCHYLKSTFIYSELSYLIPILLPVWQRPYPTYTGNSTRRRCLVNICWLLPILRFPGISFSFDPGFSHSHLFPCSGV